MLTTDQTLQFALALRNEQGDRFSAGAQYGAEWANEQNAAELAAKDAQIAELLEFVRNFHNYTHIGDYIWIDLLNDADQILAKYPE